MAFDPLAQLMAEYGPKARLGARQQELVPEYNETYRASNSYGPYGLSDAPFGGQAIVPVNRRNPQSGARHNPEPLDMSQPGLKWRDFIKAYGRLNDKLLLPTPLASQKWAEYKRMHGIVTDPKVAERLRALGAKKARKNCGDGGQASATPWDQGSEYELVRGPYGPGLAMPPVNRRNPARAAAPEFTNYRQLQRPELTFLSNTGDEQASRELPRRNPQSSGKSSKAEMLRAATREMRDGRYGPARTTSKPKESARDRRAHRDYLDTQWDDEQARMRAEHSDEESRYAQGSANARDHFDRDTRSREAGRIGDYISEQRSRGAANEASMYPSRRRR